MAETPPPVETPAPTSASERGVPNVARASGIMFLSLLLSRVLGIVRDSVMAHQFGVSADTDLYRLAFQIPDLIFFAVAGGALSSAFIPVFSEFFHTEREDDAWKLFSVVVTVMSAIVVGFIAIAWIFAVPIAHVIAPGKPDEAMPIIAHMSRILLPAQYAFFIGGLMFGTLFARQVFAVPGLGPNVYNVGIIVGALLISQFVTPAISGMTWGALGGAIIGNLVIPLFAMRKLGVKFRPSFDVKAPGVSKVFKLMLPVVLGLSLPGVYGLIMQAFGSFYADGVNTALDLSNKLMQAPLGVFGQSLALAVFPALAQHFAQKRMDLYQESLAKTLRTVIYISVPVSAAMFILAPEIVSALFAYGKGRDADLSALVACLQMFSIGVFAWCTHPILMRGFFAIQKSSTPIVLGTLTTGLFLALVFGLKDTGLSYQALPLASSISAMFLAGAMLYALQSEVGGLDVKGIVSTLGKSIVGAVAMGITIYLLGAIVPPGEGIWRNVSSVAKVGGVGLIGIWVYYFATSRMHMSEAAYLDRAFGKLQRFKPDSSKRKP